MDSVIERMKAVTTCSNSPAFPGVQPTTTSRRTEPVPEQTPTLRIVQIWYEEFGDREQD